MQFLDKNIETTTPPPKQLRLPLFLRTFFIIFVLAGLLIGVAGSLFWKHHKHVLVTEKLHSAEHILDLLVGTVKIPLLTDDMLRLGSVVRGAESLEGVAYSSVLDRNNQVRAQSGQRELEGRAVRTVESKILDNRDGTSIVQYNDPQLGQVYDLSKMIKYNDKTLGTVHLVVSVLFIEESVAEVRASLIQSIWAPGLALVLVLIVLAGFITLRVRRRTDKLLKAVEEFGNGNLQYHVGEIANNESGDVLSAMRGMSQKLISQEPSQAKLEQYLKFSSLDRILESPISQGESYAFRRQVAVMFAGIKGFGSFAGTENPENIVQALNKYISIVTRVIGKHGGYVDKVVGEAVVGIFGVSLYRENHTTRATQAALDLQEALSVGAKNESQLLSNVCVGISSGIVLSGNIGSFSKIEYSSVGESIKEAYWLSNIGHPGEIILGEEIHDLMEANVYVEALAPQKILGASDAIRCYRLLGLVEKKNVHE